MIEINKEKPICPLCNSSYVVLNNGIYKCYACEEFGITNHFDEFYENIDLDFYPNIHVTIGSANKTSKVYYVYGNPESINFRMVPYITIGDFEDIFSLLLYVGKYVDNKVLE